MSIRPVDLQVMLPKSAEVSQTYNNANRNDVQQQQFTQQFNRQVEHDSQQVVQTTKSEKQAVNKDGSNRNPQNSKKKNSGAKENEKNKNGTTGEKMGLLDVTV